jgi:hypothetical protein
MATVLVANGHNEGVGGRGWEGMWQCRPHPSGAHNYEGVLEPVQFVQCLSPSQGEGVCLS